MAVKYNIKDRSIVNALCQSFGLIDCKSLLYILAEDPVSLAQFIQGEILDYGGTATIQEVA